MAALVPMCLEIMLVITLHIYAYILYTEFYGNQGLTSNTASLLAVGIVSVLCLLIHAYITTIDYLSYLLLSLIVVECIRAIANYYNITVLSVRITVLSVRSWVRANICRYKINIAVKSVLKIIMLLIIFAASIIGIIGCTVILALIGEVFGNSNLVLFVLILVSNVIVTDMLNDLSTAISTIKQRNTAAEEKAEYAKQLVLLRAQVANIVNLQELMEQSHKEYAEQVAAVIAQQ
jgi:hypothetical protein